MAKTPWQQWVANNEKENQKELDAQLISNTADAEKYYASVTSEVGDESTSDVFDDEEFARFVNVNVLKNLSQGLTAEQQQGLDMSFVTGKQSDVGKSMLDIMDYTPPTGTADHGGEHGGYDDEEEETPPITEEEIIPEVIPEIIPEVIPTIQPGGAPGNWWNIPPTGNFFPQGPPTGFQPSPGYKDPFAGGGFYPDPSKYKDDPYFTGKDEGFDVAEEKLKKQIEMLRLNPPQWVLANPTLMAGWPPITDVGRGMGGKAVIGIDWDSIDMLSQRYDPNYANQGDMNIAKLKAEQTRNLEKLKNVKTQQPRQDFMQIPGMPEGVGIPVQYDSTGKISDINIPKLDQQIDRAIMSGDIDMTRQLLNIRDMPSPVEKLNLALQVAQSPASVHQLSQMAAGGPEMDRFGELSPYLADAAMGVFGDPFTGMSPQTGDPRTMQTSQPVPQQTNMAGPAGQVSQSMSQVQQPMGMGGAFISEAPPNFAQQQGYAALEDFYEQDPYERMGAVGTPGITAPPQGPTAGMSYQEKIAAGRGDLYGTTSDYVTDPEADFAARYQSPQYIAEQEELRRIQEMANKYSGFGITAGMGGSTPSPYSAGSELSFANPPPATNYNPGNNLSSPVSVGANSQKSPPITQSVQQALGDRGYFLNASGGQSPVQVQHTTDDMWSDNMFLPSGYSAGLPDRVGKVLQEGAPLNQPTNLLSRPEINLRTPSMQAVSRMLPEERQVLEGHMQMLGLSKNAMWDQVKRQTPGPQSSGTAQRLAGLDFRNRSRA